MNSDTSNEFRERYGPVALITGASSGIGEAFARLLARKGLDLVLVARREQRLQAIAQHLSDNHSVNITVCPCDLAEARSTQLIRQACVGLDIGLVISNAGFGLKARHQDSDPKQNLEMLAVNCAPAMALSSEFAPAMIARGRGGFLFTSSVEGFMGFPWSAAYSASKGFLNNFGEALWAELQPQGVDVLVLCPSSTDTEALDKQGIDKSQLEMMSPDEVAQIGLDCIDRGPTIIAGEANQQMVESSLAMPRRDALHMMADAMKAALNK